MDEIIAEGKSKFVVSEYISHKTIFSRVSRKSLSVSHRGVKSPMQDVEKYLMELFIQMDEMNSSLTESEGLHLANSLIEGMPLQKKILQFQHERKLINSSCDDDGPGLSAGYWKGFCRCHKHSLFLVKRKNYASNRAEWCSYSSIHKMYNLVYDAMVNSEIY